jgi:hypothetical protein
MPCILAPHFNVVIAVLGNLCYVWILKVPDHGDYQSRTQDKHAHATASKTLCLLHIVSQKVADSHGKSGYFQEGRGMAFYLGITDIAVYCIGGDKYCNVFIVEISNHQHNKNTFVWIRVVKYKVRA